MERIMEAPGPSNLDVTPPGPRIVGNYLQRRVRGNYTKRLLLRPLFSLDRKT